MVAVTSGALLMRQTLGARRYGTSVPQAIMMLNREHAVLLDIRSADAFQQNHAVQAKNVEIKVLTEQNKVLPKNKTIPIILMCATGAQAQRAVPSLLKEGYQRVYALQGGMRAWVEAQMPTAQNTQDIKSKTAKARAEEQKSKS